MIDALSNPHAERLNRYRPIIPDWTAFIEALARPLPLCLWTNTLRTTPSSVADWLNFERIDAHPLPWLPSAFKGHISENVGRSIPYVAGLYHIQEEVSMLPALLLDPQPGERILDTCGAPGSKSAQIAVAMQNRGTLISNDRSALRHRATRGILDRIGVLNAAITVHDAAAFPLESSTFDRVLVDVPCTCEGTSRKNYAAFVNAESDPSRRLASMQLAILRRAISLCRPGGRVVYATCTYAPEENELVVDAALKSCTDEIDLLPAQVDGFTSSPGITQWNGHMLDSRLERTMRVWPHQNDTGGFFVALFEKSGRKGLPIEAARPHEVAPESRVHRRDDLLDADAESKWFDLIRRRFGLPAETFDDLRLARTSKKYVLAVSDDLAIPAWPEPVSIGMPLIRTQLQYPKLTTAGAMLLGSRAARNVVEATERQARRYLARNEFILKPDQLADITDTGYVLVRHRGISLGVALCYLDEHRVLSMYPKVLSRAVTDTVTPT